MAGAKNLCQTKAFIVANRFRVFQSIFRKTLLYKIKKKPSLSPYIVALNEGNLAESLVDFQFYPRTTSKQNDRYLRKAN